MSFAAPPSARRRGLLLALATAGLAWSAPGRSSRLYRWKDKDGVTHYGDRPPDIAMVGDNEISVIPFRNPPGAMVRLRVENRGAAYQVWAENSLYGPAEVELRFKRSRNVRATPALPLRATIATRASSRIAQIVLEDEFAGGDYELELDALPGSPDARPDLDFQYRVPFEYARVRVDQGPGGRFSHNDAQNLHAVDFALPVGTPILAVRAGTVMQVESDFDKAGLNREKFGGRANFIRILHDDGGMAVYAHLQWDGVQVRVGQRVQQGQRIALSGNTGFTTGPHLHFVVQANRGMQLASIAFRMFGPLGELKFPAARPAESPQPL